VTGDDDAPRPHARSSGSPRPDPQLPPPAEAGTPTAAVDPADEPARQSAATIRAVSRLEEAN